MDPENPVSFVPFKANIEAAKDWGDARGIPVRIERDSNGDWLVEASLVDSHGGFRAVVPISGRAVAMHYLLDRAVEQIQFDRRKAFHGKTPGHLPREECPGPTRERSQHEFP